MPTIKLVVIGASGVGKTSLRGKYISGRFSTGYRATIGADFITKTVPHPRNPDESVTLQIWDTAGQERFSSLSSAFFRGADAALLIFDVTSPESMHALKKWWNDFKDKAPVEDGDVHEYCCVVVGNKMDKDKGVNRLVGKEEALEFIDELVPPFANLSSPPPPQQHVIIPQISFPHGDDSEDAHSTSPRPIAIAPHQDSSPKHRPRGTPRSSSSSRFYTDTMTTTHTTLTLYHTPSSSIYESARSSPEPPPSWSPRQRRLLGLSSSSSLSGGSASTSSVATMTPSLFAREHQHTSAEAPERGPKLFFTSAKTGEGVEDVFGYVVRRVVGRWEYEEAVGRLRDEREEVSEASGNEAIRLGEREEEGRGWSACCA